MDDIPNEQESLPSKEEPKVESKGSGRKDATMVSTMKPVMKTAFAGLI